MTAIEIKSESDIVVARSAGREMARELGFGISNQTRLATAISELTRNIIRYAGAGQCSFFDDSDASELVIRAIVTDQGPGITDIDLAMTDGFSTGESLGAGLCGTKQLVKEMHIQSDPESTTVAILIKQRRA